MAAAVQAPERLVILEPVSWQTYERLLEEQQGRGGTRFTYDGGMLEIMVLSARHEKPNRTLAQLVEVLAEELGMDIERLGSTTFKRPDLYKGFEPDSCFYIQHAEAVRGRAEIDLLVDPPPDLTIEIDITHQSLDRLPLFAAVGIPEVWRYDGQEVHFYRLDDGQYTHVSHSPAFPLLSNDDATRFLRDSQTLKSTTWLRHVREWIREAQASSEI